MLNSGKDKKMVVAPSVAEWEEKDYEDDPTDRATGTSAVESLSIEETNKLRAKLGLKPLVVDGDKTDGQNESKKDWVHEPATNIGKMQSQEKLREKLANLKEKRQHQKQFGSVKKISEQVDDTELNDATSWVERMRKVQPKNLKKLSSAQQAMSLPDSNIDLTKQPTTDGLAIAHKLTEFDNNDEGETILVLKDSNVLDDNEDVLENPHLNEVRQAKRNVQMKSMKSDYNPYGDGEDEGDNVDVDGQGFNVDNNEDRLLSKYNEHLNNQPKIPMIRIGQEGVLSVDGQAVSVSEQLRRKYGSQAISLNSAGQQPSALKDYYTHEEAVKMKPRKKRKVTSKVLSNRIKVEADSTTVDEIVDFHKRKLIKTTTDEPMEEMADLSVNDPAYDELENILAKSRSRIQKYEHPVVDVGEKVYEQAINDTTNTNEVEMEGKEEDVLVMDDTSEFVRSHTTRALSNQTTSFRNQMYDTDSEDSSDNETTNVKLEEEMVTESTTISNKPKSNEAKIEEIISESVLGKGLAASLDYAKSKGYVEEDRKVLKTYKSNLPKTIATVDDDRTRGTRNYHRGEARYESSANRGNFPEKSDYNPEIRLENVDKFGHVLSEKEAFRVLSHRFHGNRPGKLKQFKRKRKTLKRKADEISSIGTNNTDNAQKILKVISEKQKALKTPFLVLSGSAKGNVVSEPSNKLSKK